MELVMKQKYLHSAKYSIPISLLLATGCMAQGISEDPVNRGQLSVLQPLKQGVVAPEVVRFNEGVSSTDDSLSQSHPNLTLFGGLGNNILNSFGGDNLYYHLGAVAGTALIVPTDLDYKLEHYFNTHPQYTGWAHGVGITGQDLPFIVGGGLLAYAELQSDNEVLGASFAVIQASLIAVTYNSILKAVTGRPGPNWKQNSNMEDLSETFRFGFFRGGIYWGWPSGHTVASMAVVSALTNYYPDKTWLKIAGYSVVAYTMAAVTANNRGGMHWFSDAVAGALMSYTIGSTVGSYFRSAYTGAVSRPSSASFQLSPSIYPAGVNLSVAF